MLIRRKWLLSWLAAIILTGSIAFSGCVNGDWRMDDKYPLGDDDFLLFEIRESAYEIIRISKSGYVENVAFSQDIFKYKSGTLSEEDMSKLSEYIKNSGFFRLRGSYKSILKLDSLDYYGISVKGEDKIKTVYVYAEAPDPFYDVLSYLRKEVETKLQEETRYGTYVMVRMINYSVGKNDINEDDLKAHPLLEEAINNPGWFTYVGSLDDTDLEDFITQGKDYFYITFEEKQFFIGIYEWIK